MISKPKTILTAYFLMIFSFSHVSVAKPRNSSVEAKSKEHFADGKKRIAEKRYREAYQEFAAGYRLSGLPDFLFNMGEAAKNAGDLAQAKEAYRRYVELAPDGKLVVVAKERLAELEASGAATSAATVPTADAEPTGKPQNKSVETTETAKAVRAGSAKPVLEPRAAVSQLSAESPSRVNDVPAPGEAKGGSMFTRWPFWAAVGAVVAGSVTVYALTRGGDSDGGQIDWRQ